MKYRKKPVVVEAWQVPPPGTFRLMPTWLVEAVASKTVVGDPGGGAFVHTSEGTMRANVGDWIIQGVKRELYPCKPDIFAATYDPE